MSDGLRNTIAIVANVCVAVAVPAIIATQADLEGNYQGNNGPLNELVSKSLDFDLNSYQGCASGEILMNGVCEKEPANQVECGIPHDADRKWNFGNRKWKLGRKKRAATDTEEALPWSVQFTKPNNGGVCSGAIIGKNHVLSSAECHEGHLNQPLDFETILGDTISVTKVSIPTDEEMCADVERKWNFGDRKWNSGNRKWKLGGNRKRRDVGNCFYDESNRRYKWMFGGDRKRRSTSGHDISLHETATAIWSGNDIVPACVNRPSLSLFTPHEVMMTGFSSANGLMIQDGVIVPNSDSMEMAVANLEDGDRKWLIGNRKWNFGGNRKRRAVTEEYCFDGADRKWNIGNRKWSLGGNRKRRAANTTECVGSQGDAMLFQYPTGQMILGGIVQGQGDLDIDDSDKKWLIGGRKWNFGDRKWNFGGNRKRRATAENVNQITPVHDYARWIYQNSGIWSKVEEAPADAFSTDAYAPETWPGHYEEFGLAALSRSVASLVDALPALQLINDNSVDQVLSMLAQSPAANQASGLDEIPLCGEGDRKWNFGDRKWNFGDRILNGKWNFGGNRKRRESVGPIVGQCLDLNLDDMPVCGLTGGDRKWNIGARKWNFGDRKWNFGGNRKRRATDSDEGVCIGDANLGSFLSNFASVGDRKWNFGDRKWNFGNRGFKWNLSHLVP